MASGILSSRSAPHFALRWSSPISVVAGEGKEARQYYVPENVLHMHTTWFRENMQTETMTLARKITGKVWSAPAFEIYLFWACNGTLPEITSIPITESEHFNVKEDARIQDPSARERRTHQLSEWEDIMLQEEEGENNDDKPEPPSILRDWLQAYQFGEVLRVDEFMDAVMRKMCQLVWDNKEDMKTMTDDEAYNAFYLGDVRLRQFVIGAAFLNVEFWLGHPEVHELGAYHKSANWCGHFESSYNRMEERNKYDETRIERWIRTRDQAKVQELFIKKKAPVTG